jgi:hypothetical protein
MDFTIYDDEKVEQYVSFTWFIPFYSYTIYSMIKLLRSLIFNYLSLTAVALNPTRDFLVLSCEDAIQLAYGTLVSVVVLLGCLLIPEIMYHPCSGFWGLLLDGAQRENQICINTQQNRNRKFLKDHIHVLLS